MRFRVDVAASESVMAWEQVHGSARAVVYDLIREQDPEIAKELHDTGWQGSPLRPVGTSPPLFPRAHHKAGMYPTSPDGVVWMGSPVPRIAACMLAALAGRREIRWGSVVLSVKGVQLDPVADHSSGVGVFDTVSPVLVKHQNRYLLPEDPHFAERLMHNVRHKADDLGLPNEAEVEVLDAGPRRRFHVAKGFRIGARARVRVAAAPRLLDALYEWGLGLSTVEGFGWIR
ncbi:CRISPR-associated endoribonuclease Cas6 [Spongiactinospora gelatinilytica]|uniref:CRISPR-associated endoribonuclease Cas6 n=1 Tax=Spongiactinospora gelatinilytica TaxID=2666298 RepID=A0A2W2GBE8_9ACTN|nr:CRISPR-associated endoribonuclease Cas6 [Spongiactinospora gelatinilytica]